MVPESIRPDCSSCIDVTCHDLRAQKRSHMRYVTGKDVEVPKTDRQMIIAIDPSKTNTAVIIGDIAGTVSYIYEISGSGADRSIEDFCYLLTEFLGKVLSGMNIAFFAQEKVILPKNSYKSMVYLNEIRTNLNNFSRAVLGREPLEINNSAWKSAILPDGYRGRNEKGSHRWLRERYPAFYDISDDVTDAICIYMYVKYAFVSKLPVYCNTIETTEVSYATALVEETAINRADMDEFRFNPAFSIEDNARFYVNRKASIGYTLVPSSRINTQELYKHQCVLRYNTDIQNIFLLVRRN